VIYFDSSVALAQLLSEDHVPAADLAHELLVSSRLLEYEVWNRVHARGLTSSHGHEVRELLEHVEMIELTPTVLARALDTWPFAIRTLDALHLATIEYLRASGRSIELASYDTRLLDAGRALGISVCTL
jgi:predicted nucleic acid-binding protein